LPRDAVDLADALRSLLRDPEMRKRMGLESRRRFDQRFTMSSVLTAFNRCYATLDLQLRVGCGEE